MLQADTQLAAQQNRWLDHLSFANTLRETIGGAVVIQALYATAQKEWANCFDANDPDTHLIKGVFTSTQKSDAVRVYISKLVAQYMRSLGMRLTAWTKATIASENFTNVAISNRIAATQFETNYDLFKIVVTRLIGLDDALVDFALVDDNKMRARKLVAYLGLRFDVAETEEDVLSKYPDAVTYFEDLLATEAFTPDFFDQLMLNIAHYSHEQVGVDFFDMLPVFVKHHYSFETDLAEENIPLAISKLQQQGYDTITVKLQDGRTISVKSTDGEIKTLPTREERRAAYALDVLGLGKVEQKDVVNVLAEVRKAFFAENPQLHDALSTAQLPVGELAERLAYQPGEAIREKVQQANSEEHWENLRGDQKPE